MSHDKNTPKKPNAPIDTSDETSGKPSKSDKASDEKSQIAENVARYALTKFYDDLFMPRQFKHAAGNSNPKVTDKTNDERQKLAKGGNRNDKQNIQKTETPIRIPDLTAPRFMGSMAWMNTAHDQLKESIVNTSKFMDGKVDGIGNSLDHAAANAGLPKPVRDATKATSEFTKHFAGTFVSDAYEMSKLVYNPEDPAVRLVQSWGGMNAAMRMSVLRSGQNLVSSVIALGIKGADELSKRGYMENPAKALYLGNRDLSINTSLEMGKWLAKAKPADWGSLSAHAATFVIGGTEVMSGAKAIKALSQSAKLGEAAAAIKESEQLSKASKAAADTLDGTADDAGKNLSQSAPEKDTLPSQEKTSEDLHQHQQKLQPEEAREIHKELRNQLLQKQQELEKIKDQHDLVERVLNKQKEFIEIDKDNLRKYGDDPNDWIKPSEEEVELALRNQVSPLGSPEANSALCDVQRQEVGRILDDLGLGSYLMRSQGLEGWVHHGMETHFKIDMTVKIQADDVKRTLDDLGIDYRKINVVRNIARHFMNRPKDSPHLTQPVNEANDLLKKKSWSFPSFAKKYKTNNQNQQIELLQNDTRLLHQKLNKADTQLAESIQKLEAKEKLLTEQNLESKKAQERYSIAIQEYYDRELCFNHDTIPAEWKAFDAAAAAERVKTGALWEDGLLKLTDGTTFEFSTNNLLIRSGEETFLYDFHTEKLTVANTQQRLTEEQYVKLKPLLMKHQVNIVFERLKDIGDKLQPDWRTNETTPEDFYSF